MSVTLKDLAKASGVSIGTVSRALNDKNEVSAKTSERIRQLAQELGYIPNRAGRALSSQKSINYVGIVIPSINSPFFDDIKKGIDMALKEFKDLGIDVIIKEQEGWNVDTQIRALEELENSGCKAFVLCSVDSEEIRAKIASLAKAEYDSGVSDKVVDKIKGMSDKEVKDYLIKLVKDNMKLGVEIMNGGK